MACNSFVQNGLAPTVSSYAILPYGRMAYQLDKNIGGVLSFIVALGTIKTGSVGVTFSTSNVLILR